VRENCISRQISVLFPAIPDSRETPYLRLKKHMPYLLASVLLFATKHSVVWTWIHRLGGFGLILLGLADNSAVPLPGSMDIFTILLSAHNREWWPYYAVMATIGSVIGGYLTYRLAERGEKALLEKKIGQKKAEVVYKKFEKRGFFWVFVGAILPPPFPIVPVLMAAGALHYPREKFLAALAGGRAVRYFALAYVAHIYGKAIIGFFSRYYQPMLYGLIGLAVAGGIGALIYFKWYRPKKRAEQGRPDTAKAEHKVA
jgi:membrane protein YqaA with SNARE-associated domain